ncbi:MAG: hypothetical protein J3T61_08565, partial [Candidatus Brocadiales bacterium]|nr:hypothetical protein [Candidatus Bathyanammoxibius sp.]
MTNAGTCRNRSRFQQQLFCFAALLPVFAASYFSAYWLRFEGQLNNDVLRLLLPTIGWVVILKLLVFAWFRIDQSWGRYVTFHDLVAIGQAVTCSSLMIVLVDYIFLPTLTIPRSIVLIDWGAMVVGAGSLRALERLLRDRGRFVFLPSNRVASFIVGVNDSGEALLREIKRNGNLSYHVVGFIDDDARAVGTRIDGVPVVGALEDTCELALRYGVAEVLITAGYLTGRQVRQLVEDGRRNSVRVKVLPSYEQLLGGTVAIKPRQVAIEDLLRRQPVQLDMDSISQWINGRVLMVTGSAGSIGSEICRQLLQL